MTLYHALLTQNLNIQSHLMSYAHHKHSDNKLIFPTPLPLLFSDKNTASDVAQTYSSILHTHLADEDLQFLFTLIENEKISTLHWLKEFLPPDLYIPDNLHLDSLIPPQPSNNTPKTYEIHDDIPTRPITKPPLNKRGNQPTQPSLTATSPANDRAVNSA